MNNPTSLTAPKLPQGIVHVRPTLTVQDIAERTGDSERTVRHRVQQWFQRQSNPTYPRVTREKLSGDARWCYHVDALSYEQWSGEVQKPASERARQLGCTCLTGEQNGVRIAIVMSNCPVHGMLVAA